MPARNHAYIAFYTSESERCLCLWQGGCNQMVSKVSSNPNLFVFLCVKIVKWKVLQCCWEKWAVTHSAPHAVSFGTYRQTLAGALVLQQEQPLYSGFASQSPFGLFWKEPASALQGAVAFSSGDSDVVTAVNWGIAGRLKMCGQCQMNCCWERHTKDPADVVVPVYI